MATYPRIGAPLLWSTTFADGEVSDVSTALHVSPKGDVLYAVGKSYDWDDGIDDLVSEWVVRALDARTGSVLWTARGAMSISDAPHTAVFAGHGDAPPVILVGGLAAEQRAFGFVALDARTGVTRWASRYEDPALDRILIEDLVVAPGTDRLFVTGYAQHPSNEHLLVLCLDAGLDPQAEGGGDVLWVNEVEMGQGIALAVTPDEETVVVAARLYPQVSEFVGFLPTELGVVAYGAAGGVRTWSTRHPGFARIRWWNAGTDVVVDPSGTNAFVTGVVAGDTPADRDILTLGVELATGTLGFEERFATRLVDSPLGLVVSADGRTVYVAGTSSPAQAFDGNICWESSVAVGCKGYEVPEDAVVSDIVLIRYDVGTNGPRWVARYNEGDAGEQFGDVYAMAMMPEGDILVGGRVGTRGELAHPEQGPGADDERRPILLRYAP